TQRTQRNAKNAKKKNVFFAYFATFAFFALERTCASLHAQYWENISYAPTTHSEVAHARRRRWRAQRPEGRDDAAPRRAGQRHRVSPCRSAAAGEHCGECPCGE